MAGKRSRSRVAVAVTAVLLTLSGPGTMAGAQTAAPGAPVNGSQAGQPGQPGTSPGSPGPAVTAAPTTAGPVVAAPSTTAPAVSSPSSTPTTASAPTTSGASTTTPTTGGTSTTPAPTTSTPTTAPAATVPPRSLSPGQVDDVLRSQQRSGANSTAALVEALRPLQNLGMTPEETLTLGMGRFPLLGVTNWTDDWLDPRTGPPPHQHQGTDLFAAFDVPVRAPADGTVRFEDAGLGGKGAFVTTADGTYYYMAHLNGFNRDLANGAQVRQGQVIGYNGDSGNAKGGAPHVHFEVHPRGGAAVNPKPIVDAWVAEALARVPELIASFTPKPPPGEPAAEPNADASSVPPILMTTGLTRRFTAPSVPAPERPLAVDFNSAVLGPLTPPALAGLLAHD